MKKVIVFLSVCVFLWLGGFWLFVATIPTIPETLPEQADAAVILTGGSERLKAGVDLLKNGKVRTLFISGVGEGVTKGDLLQQTGYPAEAVLSLMPYMFLGFEANDTHTNAKEVAQWVMQRGIQSLFLVTSNYHMNRSLTELKTQLPAQTIYPYPVAPEHVKVGDWWQYPNSTRLLFAEYHKFVVSFLRSLVVTP